MTRKKSINYKPNAVPKNKKEQSVNIADGLLATGAIIGSLMASNFFSDGKRTLAIIVTFLTISIVLFGFFRHRLSKHRWFYYVATIFISLVACWFWWKSGSGIDLRSEVNKIATNATVPTPLSTAPPALVTPTLPANPIVANSTKPPLPRNPPAPEPEPTVHFDVKKIGFITGYIYDGETRRPLQGALIIAQNDATGRKYQGAMDGQSGFSVAVESGAYTVTASRGGYLENTQSCYARHDTPCAVYVYLQKKPQ